ncbi:MAG: bifunctional DNA-formamidopyrimidine glycosylase/DNA-(apurinic or apyrimidinic site) lyase [Terracidiphilus sp.]
MPELPEVETIACGVDARARGDRIVEAWFSSYREPFKTPPKRQAGELQGRIIVAVHRTGKHIVFELGPADGNRETGNLRSRLSSIEPQAIEPQAQWIVHLGMSGRLLVTTPDAPVAAHTHARLSLAGGLELRFIDPRRFGRLEFRDLGRAKGFAGPGAEPFTIAPADFAMLFRGRKLAIKAALLNQRLLSGVGNIYADEGLFRAGIRPAKRAGKLTGKELERLRIALCEVLAHAIRLGGSSVSDYVGADGERGFFQIEHCVYRRTGQPCPRCQTPIRRILIAGRGTHYCPHCQR